MKQAEETADDLYTGRSFPRAVTEDGLVGRTILVDLESRNMQVYWQEKQGWLILICSLCLLYFLSILWSDLGWLMS